MEETNRRFHTRPAAGAALGALLAAILGSLAPDWILLLLCALLVPVTAFLFRKRSALFLLPLLMLLVLVRSTLLPEKPFEDGAIAQFLFRLRASLLGNADALFSDEAAAARGLLLGNTDMMTASEHAQYANTGLLHLFAVSGLHVTVLVGMLSGLVRTRNRALSLAMLAVFLLFFCAITGFTASVLRAAFVLIGFRASRLLDRRPDAPSIFCLAFALTLLVEPFAFRKAGFQLSFAAMGGMVLLARTFRKAFPRRMRGWKLVSALSGSIAATVGMLPFLAYRFGALAWASIPLSILLIPTMPVILLCGFFAVLLYGIASHLSEILSYPAYGAIKLISLTARSLDVPVLRLPAPQPWVIALYFLALLLCSPLFLPNRKRPPWIGLGLLTVSILLWFVI